MLGGAVAFAQGYGPPPPPPGGGGWAPPPPVYRQGFMIGFSLGAGAQFADCDGCESQEGFAFDFSIGGFLNPNLALMYDVNAVMNFEEFGGERFILTNSANTFAAQFWVGPQFWLKGGAGFGRFFVSGDGIDAESEVGVALTGAAGYEFSVSGNFAMDLQLRLAPVFYHDDFTDEAITVTNVSILVGFNWY